MVLFRCVTGGAGGFEIAITTEDTDLYGQTITISKNGSTVGTTVFDNTGNASYTVTETGTYSVSVTYDGRTVTETVEVTAFAVDLAMGFVLEKWLEFGDISGTYASLSDVLADEDAVRQLMTIHAAVDYLASFESTDASVVTILNNDYAAKWISLTDYAMDVLEAAYGTLMGTIGKYGYGEWGITDATTTPPTWEPLGNVPVMTSNTAPYGTASAYQVFDGNPSTTASGTDFSYTFTNPVCVKDFVVKDASGNAVTGGTLQACNDGSTWGTPTDGEYYLGWRVHFAASQTVGTVQFYGRTLKVSVPKMSGNTTPYGEAICSAEGQYQPAWKVFDGIKNDNNSMWLPNRYNVTDEYVGYEFPAPVVAKRMNIQIHSYTAPRASFTAYIEGYDGSAWDTLETITLTANTSATHYYNETHHDISGDTPYIAYRLRFAEVIVTSGNNYISVSEMQIYGEDYSEREWDTEHPRRYLYDHGVEVETLTGYRENSGVATKHPSELEFGIGGQTYSVAEFYTGSIDFTDYSLFRAVAGDKITDLLIQRIVTVTPYTANMFDGTQNTVATKTTTAGDGSLPNTISLDVTSLSGQYYAMVLVGVATGTNTRLGTIKELWLE